ncbi:5549_t:CDS:2 [Racocetra fulgida]|uniref:5549_t:CDS:1 n=1 Tax=Racocetra fulgida TaxID=60492 RepID=A0A9N9A0Q1_9GLOM|nr:5549_t:CDS:2 [Racocetra fulgida]
MIIFKSIQIPPNLLNKIIWILETWNDIPVEMIIKSFKKCGISNKLDGTKDDLLYDSDTDHNEVNDNDDLIEIVEEDSLSAEELELED